MNMIAEHLHFIFFTLKPVCRELHSRIFELLKLTQHVIMSRTGYIQNNYSLFSKNKIWRQTAADKQIFKVCLAIDYW